MSVDLTERAKAATRHRYRSSHRRTELSVFYARPRDELRNVLGPKDVKEPDCPSETFRVLKGKEICHRGEYRTRLLALADWDQMEANDEFMAMGM